MSRRKEPLVEFLIEAPWQLGVILSVIAFVFMLFIFPAIFAHNKVTEGLALLSMMLAPVVAGSSSCLPALRLSLRGGVEGLSTNRIASNLSVRFAEGV